MAYLPQSGGGRAGAETLESDLLNKPYDLVGTANAELVQQLNEMLEQLYRATNRSTGLIASLTQSVSTLQSSVAALAALIGAGGSSALIQAPPVTISNASILTLSSVPIAIVSAPGANKMLIPVTMDVRSVHVAFGGYGTTRTGALRYLATGNDLTTPANLIFNVAIDRTTTLDTNTSSSFADPSSDGVNAPLIFKASGDNTLGDASNYLVVNVSYIIINV